MPDLRDSETAKNLMRAFAGESQARNRYTFAAALARFQKMPVVEQIFTYTANQEKEHAVTHSAAHMIKNPLTRIISIRNGPEPDSP